VDGAFDKYSQQRREQTGPIKLIPRNNATGGGPIVQPEAPSSFSVPPAAVPSVPQSQ
jgi:hypothetical protein